MMKNDEEVIFDEDNEITIIPNASQWKWVNIFGNLKILIVIINDFVLIYVCLMMAWI